MGLSFHAPITTNQGTAIITAAGTFKLAKGMQTGAGTSIFTAATATKFAAGAISGFKAPIPFDFPALSTNITTYANIPGTAAGSNQIASGKFAPVPWGGSILGFGVRPSAVLTVGHVSFTVMNGATALAGTTLTINTTNSSSLNLSLLGVAAKTFGANRLRARAKTSADQAGATKVNGIIWVEV